jgi:1-deoxy-D-xylulose-5-phosphate synthase
LEYKIMEDDLTLKNSFESFETLDDLKLLPIESLPLFCVDLRKFIIEEVSKIGGHLGASLGVIELTVALHYVFSSPEDKIIWDVGHQSYPHKVLTGRKNKLHTLRKKGGLSGFTSIFESPHDIFGAGHSSTSISAGLGMLAAITLKGGEEFVIPVIGDGAMSAGLAFEALNNITEVRGKMLVILNDNDMSISPPTGAISKYLPRLANSGALNEIKSISKRFLPKGLQGIAKRAEKLVKTAVIGENIFEAFGMHYLGPFDGHDVKALVELFERIKLADDFPILLHIKTEKGKGFAPAESSHDKFHGVAPFCLQTGSQNKKASGKSYSIIASQKLGEMAKMDEKITAITPAMMAGSCLERFATEYPHRFFDVGIAEQHAVTFAAGQGAMGLKPYCFIYSTFLQRAYDQVIHDVCLQKLPVCFIIDRAGIVGEDGATHNGVFDIAFLRILPGLEIISPSSAEELTAAMEYSKYIKGPLAIRFPRGEAFTESFVGMPFEKGKGRIVKNGKDIAIIAIGATLKYALALEGDFTVVDLRFIKPIDEALIIDILSRHKIVMLIEDGSIGGVYSSILEILHKNKIDASPLKQIILPDEFIEHGSTQEIHNIFGLSGEQLNKEVSKYK